MQTTTVFKATRAKDIQVGDVWQQMDEKDGKLYYYYLRAESVFVGDKVDAIHDPFTDVFVGNRVTNCVEIVWQPLNYEGRPFALRYHESVTVDVASGVVDASRLIQAEEVRDAD